MFDLEDYNFLMNCDTVPDLPVFDATIQVRIYNFDHVLKRENLQKVIREGYKDSVLYNLGTTMTKTIFDTMTNANDIFYKDMKERKEKEKLKKTNEAKD